MDGEMEVMCCVVSCVCVCESPWPQPPRMKRFQQLPPMAVERGGREGPENRVVVVCGGGGRGGGLAAKY